MSATGLIRTDRVANGMRPVNPRRDLLPVADLIETCFATTLDAAGRSAIQEMRALSRTGPLLWLVSRVSAAIPGVLDGFVWLDQGRLVGNVSLSRAGYGDGWVIANVAVHPDFRRRGIARQLMTAALDRVAESGGFAALQVEASNTGARQLYDSLGFTAQRTFTRWRRPTFHLQGALSDSGPSMRRMTRAETGQLLALVARVRPNERGGIGWLRPLTRRALTPSRWPALDMLWRGTRRDHWVVSDEAGGFAAALITELRLGSSAGLFEFFVTPERAGILEEALIAEVVRRLGGRITPLVTDHPADDQAANDALRAHYFRPERTLVHMLWTPPSGQPGSPPVRRGTEWQ